MKHTYINLSRQVSQLTMQCEPTAVVVKGVASHCLPELGFVEEARLAMCVVQSILYLR
jgi:hypothetical protein